MISSKTFFAIPPGLTIQEQYLDRGMKLNEFAAKMEMSEKDVGELIDGKLPVTLNIAKKLETLLGLRAGFWSDLEKFYREDLIKIQNENDRDAIQKAKRNAPQVRGKIFSSAKI